MLWIDGCLLWQISGILLIVLGKGLDISGYRSCIAFRVIQSSLGSNSRKQYSIFHWQNLGFLLIVLGKGLDISGYRPCQNLEKSGLAQVQFLEYSIYYFVGKLQDSSSLLQEKVLTFQVTGRVKQSEYSYSLFMSCIAFRGRKPSLAKRVTLLELGQIEDLYSFFRVKIGTFQVTCHVQHTDDASLAQESMLNCLDLVKLRISSLYSFFQENAQTFQVTGHV